MLAVHLTYSSRSRISRLPQGSTNYYELFHVRGEVLTILGNRVSSFEFHHVEKLWQKKRSVNIREVTVSNLKHRK